jgi:inosine-uridine nucleoside N-ribohydrolase
MKPHRSNSSGILVFPIFLLCAWLSLTAGAAEKQKILFDCDLAGDVDDAFALALVLASPEFDVLGLVMDHGNTAGRGRVACRMLYETGREDIPVVLGRATPGIVGEQTGTAGDSHQFVWGQGFEKIKPIAQPGADFIISKLRQYPNQVILFTVGPVCNMEDIIRKDPEALKLAKRVVSMFGSFYMGYDAGPVPNAEWNVRADVGAARAFCNSGANPLLAGLDITTFVKLDEAQRTRLLYRKSPLTDAICGLYSLWRFEEYAKPDPTLFDAVAVGMVLWPDLFTTRKAHVRVADGGFTVLDESKEPNCEIGLTIQKDEFIRRMMERLLRQNLMRQP